MVPQTELGRKGCHTVRGNLTHLVLYVYVLKTDFSTQEYSRPVSFSMDSTAIYATRALPRPSLGDDILATISKLKISFKPPFRRANFRKRQEDDNWRNSALASAVRRVREKDDPDYSEVVSNINKLSKSNYTKLMTDFLERIAKRDAMFRLRVTTLLFDFGVKSTFFAPIMADAYKDIVAAHSDALQDLATQTSMFDALYDTDKIVVVPLSTEPGYDEAILAWMKQKEIKRGFAAFVAELYSRGLVPEETMTGFLNQVCDELRESIRNPKTPANEEHVDALVRFLFAVATKVAVKSVIQRILTIPKAETPSLTFKSRFRLDDAAKASK